MSCNKKQRMHLRKVPTKKGKKKVVVNKGVVKPKVRRKKMSTFQELGDKNRSVERYAVIDPYNKLAVVTSHVTKGKYPDGTSFKKQKVERVPLSEELYKELTSDDFAGDLLITDALQDKIDLDFLKGTGFKKIEDSGDLQRWHEKNIELLQDPEFGKKTKKGFGDLALTTPVSPLHFIAPKSDEEGVLLLDSELPRHEQVRNINMRNVEKLIEMERRDKKLAERRSDK